MVRCQFHEDTKARERTARAGGETAGQDEECGHQDVRNQVFLDDSRQGTASF